MVQTNLENISSEERTQNNGSNFLILNTSNKFKQFKVVGATNASIS